MTLDELKDLYLEVAREVGAERNLRVEDAEPEDLHNEAFELKPIMMRRWGPFRRRPQFREVCLAFYKPDETQPLGKSWWVDLNELDKMNAFTFRRDFRVSLRNFLEEYEQLRSNQ
jgi:hypothetical protein